MRLVRERERERVNKKEQTVDVLESAIGVREEGQTRKGEGGKE